MKQGFDEMGEEEDETRIRTLKNKESGNLRAVMK